MEYVPKKRRSDTKKKEEDSTKDTEVADGLPVRNDPAVSTPASSSDPVVVLVFLVPERVNVVHKLSDNGS